MDSDVRVGSPAAPQLGPCIYVDRDTCRFVLVTGLRCVYCEVSTKLSCYVDELHSQNIYKPKKYNASPLKRGIVLW